ncbi:MAG: histone deacetylase [Acidobacteria bacterium]|nr:histone deacetylase [Acidobacteriota bacterium]
MQCFYSDTFVLPLPEGHRFPMAKYSRLREKVLADGVVSADEVREAPQASWDDLRLVHTLEYTTAVADGRLSREAQRRIGFPWSLQMVERSRRSVGATIAAASVAIEEGCAANLAGGTHHAFADRGEGYCVFNDVAVGARVLQRDHRIGRVAVIDCDVHQGNGTAAIFAGDASVFTLSLHGARNYPFKKEKSDLDVEFDDGTGDEPYLTHLAHSVDEVLARQDPEVVFYLAGADPYEGDRLGRLKLTIAGLQQRDQIVLARCRAAGVPVVVTMSGGYAHDVNAIVAIHVNTIRAAAALQTPQTR